MIRKPSDIRDTTPDRAERIKRIIDDVMRRRAEGQSVDEAALERRHADLLPELRDRLTTLRTLEAAARRAGRQSSEIDPFEEEMDVLKEEQALLEASLKGYRILQRIEYGGQGVIYKAVQLATKRIVAIKVLLHGPLASDQQRRRFEREVDLVSRLRHPHIVVLYDSGAVRGRPYFAMEYIDGVGIDDYLIFERPSIRSCVELFAKVCRAVGYAHQRGIIHRDLKPENILVDESGVPHILDFGLGKLLEDRDADPGSVTVTLAGRVVGTTPYLSPERVGSPKEEMDVRSDIYSLGVVLYRLLTGRFPYPVHGSLVEVYANIINLDPMDPCKAIETGEAAERHVTGPLHDDLARILLKSLAKEPDRRYQSAIAFADDLDRYLAGEAVAAKADSSLYVFTKTLRRYRLQVGFSAAIMALLLAGSVLVTSQWFRAREERENARKAVAIGLSMLDDVITGALEAVETLAGGSRVQEQIFSDVRARYERLMPLVESDAAWADVRGRIHERLGDMARQEGRHTVAEKHYEDVLATRRDFDPQPDRWRKPDLALLRVLRKLGSVAEEGGAWFERAIRTGQALLAADGADPEVRYELCGAHVDCAHDLFDLGRYTEAAEQIETAVSMAEAGVEAFEEDVRWLRLLATARKWAGESQINLGDGERGIALLESSLKLRESLLPSLPADVSLRGEILKSNLKLGDAYYDDGRADSARQLYQKAIEMGEYLLQVDPEVADWMHDLMGSHNRLAKVFLDAKDFDQAEPHCKAALQYARALVKIEPDNPRWQGLLGFACDDQGKLHRLQGEWPLAYDWFNRSLEIRKRVASADPSGHIRQTFVAFSHDRLAKCCIRLGRMSEAFEHYEAARSIRERLMKRQPGIFRYALSYIHSQIQLSSWHLYQETREGDRAAGAWLDEAEAQIKVLDESGRFVGMRGKYTKLIEGIENNRRIIRKRAARRRTAEADTAPP